MKSQYETRFTSTTAKLLHNLDRLAEMQRGIFRPISVQLAPTDLCNLTCDFCSVANREMKELTIEQCITVLEKMKAYGAKTVELTGGGDPTMYRPINDLIGYAYQEAGYQIGMITNGIALNRKVTQDRLSMLTWLRVSLNSLDYVSDIHLEVPDAVALGFSYVWNNRSTEKTLARVISYAEKYKARYVRIVPNCLNVEEINKHKETISRLVGTGNEHVFVQQKEYVVPKRCWMGYIKPFVNSDGYIYWCSANPLIERKFHPAFRMGSIDEIDKIWGKDQRPFDTCNCQEGKCFFAEHNELIDNVIMHIEHKDFI